MTSNRIFVGRKPTGMSARPWSRKGNLEIINMSSFGYTVAIDDLLKIVSPELLKGYETINLNNGEQGTVTLKQTNEEYKKAMKSQHDIPFKQLWLLRFGLIAGLLLLVASVSYGQELLCIFVESVVAVVVSFWLGKSSNKKLRNARGTVDRTKTILEDFRRSVETLRNPNGATDREYTAKSVRDNFFTHAVRILDGEKKLDIILKQKERRVFDLRHICNWTYEAQEKFEKATWAAEKFGLKFSRRELFAEATKYLERQAAQLASQ